jgi:glycosyltransferase involved in cell wall biosynthesis
LKILVVADYPRPGHPFSAIFNERCVRVLQDYCEVEVIAHRPYVPSILSHAPRWRSWVVPKRSEVVRGVSVHRPAYLQIPRLGSAFWIDRGAYLFCRPTARELHRIFAFDAIMSFDLLATGALAWRIGRDLGIPASGWAFGSDMRQRPGSQIERVVSRAIKHLDLVFYQSRELLEIAARCLGVTPEKMSNKRHVVLPHGVPDPVSGGRTEARARVRAQLGLKEDHVLVLSVGSLLSAKGIFELLEALSLATVQDDRIRCVLVGSLPAFDETAAIKRMIDRSDVLKQRVRLIPACVPDQVWEYLCAADIFAFTSHKEGMPNSLLEALGMGVPAIAFAIPPVLEVDAQTGSIVIIPPLDSQEFSRAILRLAASPAERARIGENGRVQVMQRFSLRKNMGEALNRLRQVISDCALSSTRLSGLTSTTTVDSG